MFGLTLEKLFLVALLSAVLVGPTRLPGYAAELAAFVRRLRALVDQTREATERELGVPLDRSMTQWHAYDPRRIVREALIEEPVAADAEVLAQAAAVRPGQRFLVTGSAAHPRRVLIASLDPDDPRRRAAEWTVPHDVAPAADPAAQDGRGEEEPLGRTTT